MRTRRPDSSVGIVDRLHGLNDGCSIRDRCKILLLSTESRNHLGFTQSTRVEAGSNTSTVTLRVVRGDEMGLNKAAP
jgi:hypothetical protein